MGEGMASLLISSTKLAIVAQRVHHGCRWSECMPPFGPISPDEVFPCFQPASCWGEAG